jgi:spindle assembly abnormal protein 6
MGSFDESRTVKTKHWRVLKSLKASVTERRDVTFTTTMLTLLGVSKSPEQRRARNPMDDDRQSTPGPSKVGREDDVQDDDDDRLMRTEDEDDARTATTTTTAHVVDGDGGNWTRQNVRLATLVYDGSCMVRVRESGGSSGERRIEARVRVMVGNGNGNGDGDGDDGDRRGEPTTSRMLRVHVSCDHDPFFYHAMEVREEDYAKLRAEQRLVVSFDEFPKALVRLIRACDGGGDDAQKDVYCVLDVPGPGHPTPDVSTFSIVETNAFNQFTHVALKFKPASDRAAKRILAGLLMDARERERELKRFEKLYRESQGALESSRAKSIEAQMKYAEASAKGKREILDELERARERYEADKRELRKRMDDALQAKAEAEREKFAAQNKVSELGTKLGLIEGELAITKRELQRVREDNAALDAEVHERDKAHSARALRVEWLEKQLGDKEEVIELLKSRLDASEEHKVALAASWEQARRALGKAEERVAASAEEINKGNGIIEELHKEVRAGKIKTKIQAAVIKKQEALLEERQMTVRSAAGERAEASLETENLLNQIQALRARESELTGKLEESNALLQSNQQVIQWLNSELTAANAGKPTASAIAGAPPRLSDVPRSPLIDLSSPAPAAASR